jgi:hypothetical protein
MMKKTFLLLVFLLTLISTDIYATNSVVPSTVVNHNATINTSITTTWGTLGPSTTNTSTSGRFQNANGAQLGSSLINTTIIASTAPCTRISDLIQACTVTETFQIPNDVLAAAASIGLTTIFYQRTFTDGIPASGALQINLTYSSPSLSVSPSNTTFTVGTTSVIPATWNLSTFGNASGIATSTFGTFKSSALANASLGTGGSSISTQNIIPNGTGTTTSPVAESITIPANVLLATQQQNLSSIVFIRIFTLTINGRSVTASSNIQISLNYPAPGISVAPAITNFINQSTVNIPVTWNVSTFGNATGSITSSVGTFTSAENISSAIGTNNVTLSAASPAVGLATSTNFQETLTIPASVLSTAELNNLTSIFYIRQFTVGSAGTTAARFMRINISSLAPTLSVSPIASSFTPGSNTPVTTSWSITTFGNGSGNTTSADGLFTSAQNATSTIGTTASNLIVPSLVSGTVISPETFTIPQSVVDTALQNNFSTIYYSRIFNAGNAGDTARVFHAINIGTSTPVLTVSPTISSFEVDTNINFNANWSITTFGDGSGATTSTEGLFTSAQNATSTIGSPITTNLSVSSLATGTVLSVENIIIPQTVLDTALQNNLTRIYYSRVFNAGASAGNTGRTFRTINLTYKELDVSSNTPVLSLPADSSSTIATSWSVESFGNGAGTAASTNGIFSSMPNTSTEIGRINTRISRASQATGTSVVPETITIPQTVLDTAENLNLSRIYYSRTFTAGSAATSEPVFLTINLGSSNPQAILSINRIALRFNDNQSVKLAPLNSRIAVLADILFKGTGLLDTMWEIADPTSTIGTPIFIPALSVRQYLAAGSRITLQSPMLPTHITGNYKVRLNIRTPALSYALPVISYTISSKAKAGRSLFAPIKLNAPVKNALIQKDTRFSWYPIKGSKAYQLEIYLPDLHNAPDNETSEIIIDEAKILKKKPSTGILIPAKKTSLSLGALSRDTLRHGQRYYWRIIAINADGNILTTSPLRAIRTP